MNILERARAFVQSLLKAPEGHVCPYCGKRYTKRHGSYERTLRDVGGAQEVRIQRHWCHLCQRSYSEPDRRFGRYQRYARRVQRKALDLYVHVGGSLRTLAEVLRGEVAPGAGRSRVWEPWLAEPEPGMPGARLSHVTIWRWTQRAGARALSQMAQQAWAGVIRFSGGLVADATGVCVRGVWYSLHLVSDLASRLALKVERLLEEDQKALKRHFQGLVRDWQLKRSQAKLLVTDGASAYGEVLERVLPQAAHQRCLFHLWRNLLPDIAAYEAQAGERAAQFVRFCLKALWALPSLDDAYSALEDLERTFSPIPALADLWQTVRRTLREALAHTRHLVEAVVERTSNVAERFFRGYKRRFRMMGCFMSLPGCDHFTAVWQVYTAFQPYQLRKERQRFYRYPGQSPLLIAQAPVEGLSWLDALQM